MKLTTVYILIVVSLLAFTSLSLITSQSYLLQRNYGIWSDMISAQSDIGDFPSQYFVCGVSFRQSKWSKLLWNCNCGTRWYKWKRSWRCNWCNNDFWTETNAVKIKFCSYSDWNMQIQKTFETGNTQSGKWRQVNCPKGQYASKISGRFGSQNDVDTGFVGVQIKCQNINFSQNILVQDNYGHALSELSKNKQGNFVSGLQIKYVKDQNLVGVKWNFESMPTISKISVKYAKLEKLEPTSTIIDSAQVSNYATTIVQKTVGFSKTYQTKNRWTNALSYTNGYMITQGISMNPLPYVDDKVQYSTYSSKTQNFTFNKQIKTTYSSNQQMVVLVPSNKNVKISSIIQEQKVNVPYQATLTFSDRFTGNPIGERVVKGIWQGVMASSVKTVITESVLPPIETDINSVSKDVPSV